MRSRDSRTVAAADFVLHGAAVATAAQARLWRFIFLQEREGFFEPTNSIAFALLALSPKQLPKRKVFTGIQKYLQKFNRADDDLPDYDDEDEEEEKHPDGHDEASRRLSKHRSSTARMSASGHLSRHHQEPPQLKRGQHLVLQEHAREEFDSGDVTDCPLTYSTDALWRTMPRVLKRVNDLPRPPRHTARGSDRLKPVAGAATGRTMANRPPGLPAPPPAPPQQQNQGNNRGPNGSGSHLPSHEPTPIPQQSQQLAGRAAPWRAPLPPPAGRALRAESAEDIGGYGASGRAPAAKDRIDSSWRHDVGGDGRQWLRGDRAGGLNVGRTDRGALYLVPHAQQHNGSAGPIVQYGGEGSTSVRRYPAVAAQPQLRPGGRGGDTSAAAGLSGSNRSMHPPPPGVPHGRGGQPEPPSVAHGGGKLTLAEKLAIEAQKEEGEEVRSETLAGGSWQEELPCPSVAHSLTCGFCFFVLMLQVNTIRVWTTALALACLESIDITWLVDPEEGKTIVDQARIWLDNQAQNDPRLHKILPDVMKQAQAWSKRWNVAFQDRVHDLRNEENASNRFGLNAQMALEASGTIVKSLLNDHDTFSVFLSECFDGLARWQRLMIVMTLVIGGLMITIWFYSSRATNCCLEVRTLLGCSPLTTVPCRGYEGCVVLARYLCVLPRGTSNCAHVSLIAPNPVSGPTPFAWTCTGTAACFQPCLPTCKTPISRVTNVSVKAPHPHHSRSSLLLSVALSDFRCFFFASPSNY